MRRPHRWDSGIFRRFMIVFGSISSILDHLIFPMLLWLLRADETVSHTGRFMGAVVSDVQVIYAVRIYLPLLAQSAGLDAGGDWPQPWYGLRFGCFIRRWRHYWALHRCRHPPWDFSLPSVDLAV